MSVRPTPTVPHAGSRDRALLVRSVFVVLAAAMLLLVAYAAAATEESSKAGPTPSSTATNR